MAFSCVMAAARSDSFKRVCATCSKTVSPSAKVASVARTGSMSGMSRQSTVVPRSRTPSWRTRSPRPGSISIGTPMSRATRRKWASGWSAGPPSSEVMPRSRTSAGWSAAAATAKAAEPMSGGRVTSLARARCPGSTAKRRQSCDTSTRSPNCRIIATVSSR